jgi:hypothetical protein
MILILGQMALLVCAGLAWQWLRPGGLDAVQTRKVVTGVVYYLLLPALVLLVLWQAELGLDSLRIALAAAVGVLAALLLSAAFCRLCGMPGPVTGAVMLAAAFPNATYLGLPVLEGLFGPWARGIAIQYDLFACTPLLLTVGILVAQRLGGGANFVWFGFLRVPALWAALLALVLKLGGVAMPALLAGALERLSSGVVPLMLLALGMSLRMDVLHSRRAGALLPIVVIQLFIMPALVWGVAGGSGLEGEVLTAVVLEGAMPSMVLGIVICERYGLDTALFAAATTVTTLLCFFTLPLWFAWV